MLEAITDGILVPGEEDHRNPSAAPPPMYTSMGPPTPPLHSAPTVTVPPVGVGRVFGGTYQLEAPLGAGGMGEVWIARHLRTGRKYALKLLPQDSRMLPDAIRRFEREALAASALGHPNIVAVHDFNLDSGVHYMIMDLLEGETLEARLMRLGCLPWEDAKRIGLELASALGAAHAAGLLHRDLKPANVLLARSPEGTERAVLLDFGLVKPLDEVAISKITMAGAAMGTPMYMSPEQARGEGLDARSDLYALGAVLFEVLTGAPPFFDRTLAGVYARLLNELPPAASSVSSQRCPPAFDTLLAATLAKNPAERPPDARAFAAALAQVEDNAPATQRIA
jgi:serine/threonine-protein kinase